MEQLALYWSIETLDGGIFSISTDEVKQVLYNYIIKKRIKKGPRVRVMEAWLRNFNWNPQVKLSVKQGNFLFLASWKLDSS